MSVLPDHEIEARSDPNTVMAFNEVVVGAIGALFGGPPSRKPMIDPYSLDQLAPSSYDVRLASVIKVPYISERPVDLRKPVEQTATEYDMDQIGGWVLRPGGFVLASTVEWVNIPDNLVCRIEGKSSLARSGLQIHSAGFIDPGYEGNITLEITNFGPDMIHLWPDVLIAQLCFEHLSSPCREPYHGRYQGSKGVVESRYNKVVASV